MIEKKQNSNQGVTIVELILTVAVMAILAGTMVNIIQSMNYANTKRCAKEFNALLDKVRTDALGKEESAYLYLYSLGGDYYINTTKDDTIDVTKKAKKFASTKVKVYYTQGGTEQELTDGSFIKIGFTKDLGTYQDGALSTDAHYYDKIRIENSTTSYTIRMVKLTGRHYWS